MIARLRGKRAGLSASGLVLDVNGVGYLIQATPSVLRRDGEELTVETYLVVREDALQLYGFASGEEEELFHLLIGVSGVGPRLGINILSGMPAGELAVALEGGEIARLTRIPGVGKKTAERLVVELKDRIKTTHLLASAGRTAQAGGAGRDRWPYWRAARLLRGHPDAPETARR